MRAEVGFIARKTKNAQQTLQYCEKTGMGSRIAVPQMRFGPSATIKQLRAIIQAHADDKIVLIGSSLGGYYATYLAETYGLPAVLINPAIRPFEYWRTHLGEHRNYYSDEIHVVTEPHIVELKELEISQLSIPQNFMVLVQTGDETLDYRQAIEKFSASLCIVRDKGNHSYENFASELPDIFDFLLSRID